MTRPVERFPGLPVARTSDVDEARESVTAMFLPHDLRLVDRAGALDMRLNAVRSGPVTAGFLRYGPDLWMRTAEASCYHVNIPLSGVVTSRSGRRDRVVAAGGRAAVFMPGAPAEIHWSAGSAQLCLMLARDVVDRELERLLGRELTRPLEFAVSMDLTGAAAAGWLATLDVLEREATRPDGITRFRLAAAYLENLIIDGLLLAQPHNYRDALALAASAPRSGAVRRAAELLHDHTDQVWSTATLAAAVSVSARTLQEGFARSFGVPPMTYLRTIRLDRVHADLVAADPATVTISSVAARWGFVHPGRFAAAYRRRFGVSPSATVLRRSEALHRPG
jgi:AraC-like DNA-binding protein